MLFFSNPNDGRLLQGVVGLYELNPGDPQLERRLLSTLEPIKCKTGFKLRFQILQLVPLQRGRACSGCWVIGKAAPVRLVAVSGRRPVRPRVGASGRMLPSRVTGFIIIHIFISDSSLYIPRESRARDA
jgi:hypothetical protein